MSRSGNARGASLIATTGFRQVRRHALSRYNAADSLEVRHALLLKRRCGLMCPRIQSVDWLSNGPTLSLETGPRQTTAISPIDHTDPESGQLFFEQTDDASSNSLLVA